MLKKTPNYIKYIAVQLLLLFSYVSIHRIVFYHFFSKIAAEKEPELWRAIIFGIRFDIKLAVIAVFPIAILIFIFNTKYFSKSIFKRIAQVYFPLAYLSITLFYLFDYGYYDYLHTRLDATSLRFFSNLKISTQVLFESYPVYKGIFALLVFVFLVFKLASWSYKIFSEPKQTFSKKTKAFYIIVPFFLLAFGIYNSLTHYPLRWSQAFFSKNNDLNQFSLNPVLYFFDSFAFRNSSFDLEKTKAYYPAIADYLQLPKDTLNFTREVKFDSTYAQKPNIVVVMLESVGVAPMSSYGNPINSTPKMDSLLQKSVHFTNFYVHKAGTAASVFASISGLPDIDNVQTASRNPMVIDQRIIYDQFDGYEKLYFLGGSANWANIRGLFQSNIRDLTIFEEGSYEVENRADVWGIDDYELFKESNKELEKLHKKGEPFIAYIQTATNHMPFTVPDVKEAFKPLTKEDVSTELLNLSGFKSVAQLNALRYLDFNVSRYLERAKESGYYDNTLFFFFGDHNTAMNQFDFLSKDEYRLGMHVHHVPFFIHAPKFVTPKTIDKHANLIDLYPTVAALAKINHKNYTLGSNLLDSTRTKHASFLYKKINGEPAIQLIQDNLYFSRTLQTHKTSLFNTEKPELGNIIDDKPNTAKRLDSLLLGFYHGTKYLYYNNKKSD